MYFSNFVVFWGCYFVIALLFLFVCCFLLFAFICFFVFYCLLLFIIFYYYYVVFFVFLLLLLGVFFLGGVFLSSLLSKWLIVDKTLYGQHVNQIRITVVSVLVITISKMSKIILKTEM